MHGPITWICKWRRTLEDKNKQGDKQHITRERYCKIYKIPTTKILVIWSSWKTAKLTNPGTNWNSYNGRKKWRPCKRWREKVEGELNTMGIKTDRQCLETVGNEERQYWKPRSTIARTAWEELKGGISTWTNNHTVRFELQTLWILRYGLLRCDVM